MKLVIIETEKTHVSPKKNVENEQIEDANLRGKGAPMKKQLSCGKTTVEIGGSIGRSEIKDEIRKKYIETVLFATTSSKRTPNTLFTGKQTAAVSGRTAVRTSEKHVQWRPKELIREQKNCNYRE